MDKTFWIDALEKQILSIAVGGCTCDTKSPDMTFHAPDCHYLRANNALGMVEELREELDEARKIHVTDDMVSRAWTAHDHLSGYSKPERFRAALKAALSSQPQKGKSE